MSMTRIMFYFDDKSNIIKEFKFMLSHIKYENVKNILNRYFSKLYLLNMYINYVFTHMSSALTKLGWLNFI